MSAILDRIPKLKQGLPLWNFPFLSNRPYTYGCQVKQIFNKEGKRLHLCRFWRTYKLLQKKKKKKYILAPLSIDKYFCSFPICLDFVGNTKKNFFLRIFFSASGSKFWVCLGEENKNDKVWHYEKTFIQIQGVPSIGTHFRFQFLTFLIVVSKRCNSAILT